MIGIASNNNEMTLMANVYAKPLLKLDEDLRLEIMHILLDSVRNPKESKDRRNVDLFTCFHGSWGEGESAEDYCAGLREGIGGIREVEAW